VEDEGIQGGSIKKLASSLKRFDVGLYDKRSEIIVFSYHYFLLSQHSCFRFFDPHFIVPTQE
jgi:hypothetical protein